MSNEKFGFAQRVNNKIQKTTSDIAKNGFTSKGTLDIIFRSYTNWILLELAEEFKLQAQSPTLKG